jgi:phthiocerol/phenolphthiocerol synthesis type-I polyketide synthase D
VASTPKKQNKESLVRDALLELRRMRERVGTLEKRVQHLDEPIAVIGMGCRFPLGKDPASFWDMLSQGLNAVKEFPQDRWDVDAFFNEKRGVKGKMYVESASCLDSVDRFDAAFFGISTREAHMMDPQQRLLLEVSWEALESSGIVPERLKESKTGVFVGSMTQDYSHYFNDQPNAIDIHTATGLANAVLAGRIAYLLGLQGPAMQVDTACSSSLTAIHLACQSLRLGECDTALAGGVNLILTPLVNIAECRANMLATDGCCKTFDERADGYGRGEGCGVVVLKKLSDAIADGDPILAKIRGSAINHDGPSSGLTVPNENAQEKVILEALENAGLGPNDIQYIETHGTGTSLGDPIEVSALNKVFGTAERTSGEPLTIGAVKTNIGHQEGAAGIAGVIKVILALQNFQIPPHLYCEQKNPHIPWDRIPIQLPQELHPWPKVQNPRMAGVSSFGFSGTNVHMILEEAPSKKPSSVSALNALKERSAHLLTLSAKSDEALREVAKQYIRQFESLEDIAFKDVCFSANSGRSHFAYRLALVARDTKSAKLELNQFLSDRSSDEVSRKWFHGGKVQNGGKVAYVCSGNAELDVTLYETSLHYRNGVEECLAILKSSNPGYSVKDLSTGNHALASFVANYASAELLKSLGIHLGAVIGIGSGNGVAACLAGLSKLDVLLPQLSCGVSFKEIPSQRLDGMEYLNILSESINCEKRLKEFFGNPTSLGLKCFVVLGKLDSKLSDFCSQHVTKSSTWICSDPRHGLLGQLACLYARGIEIKWNRFDDGFSRKRIALPSYPFQRKIFWYDAITPPEEDSTVGHPLLDEQKPIWAHQPNTRLWEPNLSKRQLEYLKDHQHGGRSILPVAAYIEMILAAAKEAFNTDDCRVEQLKLHKPALFSGTVPPKLQISYQPLDSSKALCQVYAKTGGSDDWDWSLCTEAHVTGVASRDTSACVVGQVSASNNSGPRPDPDNLLFGTMFFAASEESISDDRYQMIIESSRFADQNGFSSVWVPERHFTKMGCLYPNPAILQSALARETSHLRLMAGSVVLPLHNPVQTAEDWLMVDNLSNGRIGISVASGWLPNDFALAPDNYDDRHGLLRERIDQIKKIWRGEPFEARSGNGKTVMLNVFPPPVQKELPIWFTVAGNPSGFEYAGKIGANLLTHLLNQDIETLEEKITLYRKSRAEHGFDPDEGIVTVMTHTFVGPDIKKVLEIAREPYCDYLKENVTLFSGLAYSRNSNTDTSKLKGRELDEFAHYIFDRFYKQRSLIGTPESCLDLTRKMQAAGVNEVASLLDFGPSTEDVLSSLKWLKQLKEMSHQPISGEKEISPQAVKISTSNRLKAEAPEKITKRCEQELKPEKLYNTLAEVGVVLEGSLRRLDSIFVGDREAIALIKLPAELRAQEDQYSLHPVFLDLCFQTLFGTLYHHVSVSADKGMMIPAGVQSIEVFQTELDHAWCHAKLMSDSPDRIVGDFDILNDNGEIMARIMGYTIKRVGIQNLPQKTENNSDGFYELTWQPQNLPLDPAIDFQGLRWLVFCDSTGIGENLVKALTKSGVTCLSVLPGETTETPVSGAATLNLDRPEEIETIFNWALSGDVKLDRVIYLWACNGTPSKQLNADSLMRDQILNSHLPLRITQSLCNHSTAVDSKIWFITRGAQMVVGSDLDISVGQSPLWGFARSVVMEHPEIFGGLIDLDAQASAPLSGDDLFNALTLPLDDDSIAFRRRELYVERLTRQQISNPQVQEIHWRSDAAYLVTGGLGGMGLSLANWMADQGVRHIVLLGRSELPGRDEWSSITSEHPRHLAISTITALESKGVEVTLAALDAGDKLGMTKLRESLKRSVAGIFHAAGLFEDCPLRHLETKSLDVVMHPKVLGTWVLNEVFGQNELDFFILFSSFSSFLPARGQASYAAANSFLDAFACYRRSHGQTAMSVNWGPWSDIGFGATDFGQKAHERLEQMGIKRTRPDEGFEVLHRLINADVTASGFISVDWAKLAKIEPALSRSFFDEVADRNAAGNSSGKDFNTSSVVQNALREGSVEEGVSAVKVQLLGLVADIMNHDGDLLDTNENLNDLGLDSLMAVEIKNRVQTETGVDIPIIQVLDGMSVSGLTEQVMKHLHLEVLQSDEKANAGTDSELEEFTI